MGLFRIFHLGVRKGRLFRVRRNAFARREKERDTNTLRMGLLTHHGKDFTTRDAHIEVPVNDRELLSKKVDINIVEVIRRRALAGGKKI